MKKIQIFIFSALAIFIIIFFIINNSETERFIEIENAKNIQLAYNKAIRIRVKNLEPNKIGDISLKINDSLIKKWKYNSHNLTFEFNSINWGLGNFNILFEKKLEDGTISSEEMNINIVSDIIAKSKKCKIINIFPHDPLNFTQGFEFFNDFLYESTGQNGESKVIKTNYIDGKSIIDTPISQEFFGEGITILNNKIFEITWQQNTCFVYNINNISYLRKYNYEGEGWGLCNDGKNIIMSDGSANLFYRDPSTFKIIKKIVVCDQDGPIDKLNELEFHNGKIYANIWTLNMIIEIEAKTGRVLSYINASELEKIGKGNTGDVLNGIAYFPKNNTWFLTGKRWEKTFEVVFE